MRIQLLGPVRVWRDADELDPGGTGPRAVLALLAMAGGAPVRRAELADALWGDRPPRTASNVIHTYIKLLRRSLEPDRRARAPSTILPSVREGYALRVPDGAVDLARFRGLVAEAQQAQQAGDPARAADLLRRGLRLWQGPPLADVDVLAEHPAVVALSRERWAAVTRYAEAAIAGGAGADAVTALRLAAAAQPLDETVHALLIRAYQQAGRRADAFALYHAVRRRLADELGLDPGAELSAAHTALLHDDLPPPPARPGAGAGPRPPAQLPADVRSFVGREPELTTLDSALAAGGGAAPVICVVTGPAGVGKTALVLRAAHRWRDRFPDGQLYANLRGYDPEQPVPPADALERFLRAVGLDGDDIPADPDEREARYRTVLDGRRMLIVLDNAASAEQVRPLLPGAASCVVLVTSRDSLAGLVAQQDAFRLELPLLPAADAVALLAELIGPRVGSQPAAASALAERCARLPLALRVAAELANRRPGTDLAALVHELGDHTRRLDLLDAGGDPRLGVRAVLSWSYRHLPPAAARLFPLLGLHPGADLDPYAVAALAGAGVPETGHRLDGLAAAHLVQPDGSGRFALHDLLAAYAAELATAELSETEQHAARARLFDHYLHTAAAAMDIVHPAERHLRPRAAGGSAGPPFADAAAATTWLDIERSNLVAVTVHAAGHGWHRHAVDLSTTLWRYLESRGHLDDAVLIHDHALSAGTALGDPEAQADALASLGIVYYRQDRYQQAIEQLERALARYREAGHGLGEARMLSNLGAVHAKVARWAPAEKFLQQARVHYRQIGSVLGEGRALTKLGAVYEAQGQYPRAIAQLRQAIACFRECGSAGDEAAPLHSIGSIYRLLGRLGPASEHLQQALARAEQAGERYAYGQTLSELALVYLRQGRTELAADHCHRALLVGRELADLTGEARALDAYGEVRQHQGELLEAIDLHRQALDLYQRLDYLPGQAVAHNNLGGAVCASGRAAEARSHHAAALALATDVDHRYEVARAHAGLARAHAAAGEQDRAREHWARSLERYAALGAPEADEIRKQLGGVASSPVT